MPVNSAQAEAITVVSVLAPSRVDIREQFTVEISVQPATALAGLQFDLSFDPSFVTVNAIKEGQFLRQDGAATYFLPGTIDNIAGTITGLAGVIVTPGETVTVEGTFAIITMTTKTEYGLCSLNLSDVIVADINGNTVPVSVLDSQLIIGVNQPPVLNPIGNKSVNKGELLTFTISATDADGDNLIYSASNLPKGAYFDPLSQTFTWTPRGNQLGAYGGIQFVVSDGNLSDSESINITVDNVERTYIGKGKRGGPKK